MLEDFQQRFAGRAFTVADVAREYLIKPPTVSHHIKQMGEAILCEKRRVGRVVYNVYRIKDGATIQKPERVQRRVMRKIIRDEFGDREFTIRELAAKTDNSLASVRKMVGRLVLRGELYMRYTYASRGKRAVYSTKDTGEPCWLEKLALIFKGRPFRASEARRLLGVGQSVLSQNVPWRCRLRRGWYRLPDDFVESVVARWAPQCEEERAELQLYGSARERYEEIARKKRAQ